MVARTHLRIGALCLVCVSIVGCSKPTPTPTPSPTAIPILCTKHAPADVEVTPFTGDPTVAAVLPAWQDETTAQHSMDRQAVLFLRDAKQSSIYVDETTVALDTSVQTAAQKAVKARPFTLKAPKELTPCVGGASKSISFTLNEGIAFATYVTVFVHGTTAYTVTTLVAKDDQAALDAAGEMLASWQYRNGK